MKARAIGFTAYTPGLPPHIMSVEVTAVPMDKERGILDGYVDKKMISGKSGSPVLDDKN